MDAIMEHPTRSWKSQKHDNREGYWTREELVVMNRNALLKLIQHHPNMTPPGLRAVFAKIRRKAISPEYAPESLDSILSDMITCKLGGSDDIEMLPPELAITQVAAAKEIRRQVAARYGITTGELDGASREKIIVMARHEAMYIISRDCYLLSYTRLGRMFGGRDHSTVMAGVRQHAHRNGLPRVREGVAPA